MVADLFLALILCHNVTPVTVQEEEDDSDEEDGVIVNNDPQSNEDGQEETKMNRMFQSSSPDDIALVKFAEQLGMRLENREELFVEIKDINDRLMNYEILENFPFSSNTKRLGIIVRNKDTQ